MILLRAPIEDTAPQVKFVFPSSNPSNQATLSSAAKTAGPVGAGGSVRPIPLPLARAARTACNLSSRTCQQGAA